jgi:hypothetical protein
VYSRGSIDVSAAASLAPAWSVAAGCVVSSSTSALSIGELGSLSEMPFVGVSCIASDALCRCATGRTCGVDNPCRPQALRAIESTVCADNSSSRLSGPYTAEFHSATVSSLGVNCFRRHLIRADGAFGVLLSGLSCCVVDCTDCAKSTFFHLGMSHEHMMCLLLWCFYRITGSQFAGRITREKLTSFEVKQN